MDDDRREALRLKYLSLGTGELAAVVVFALIALHPAARALGPRVGVAVWSGLGPFLLVLIQGGAYWLAARSWVGVGTMPPGLAAAYRAFRVLDALLLAAGLAGIVAFWPEHPLVAGVVLLLWAFGVGQYLNYFVVRLAYPVPEWFDRVRRRRTPQLIRDLRAATR